MLFPRPLTASRRRALPAVGFAGTCRPRATVRLPWATVRLPWTSVRLPWTSVRLLVCLMIAAAGGLAKTAVAHASGSCAGQFGSFGPAGAPACWLPYGDESPFNRQLPANPTVSVNSDAQIANLQSNDVQFEGGGSSFALTTDGGRDAVYYARPSDPVVTLHCTYHWGPGTCQGSDGVDIDGKQIKIPAGAQPAPGSDAHMTIVDQADGLEYDFEHASWGSSGVLDVWSGSESSIGGDSGTGLGAGATAAGFATLAGLITAPELASGHIDHALVVSVPCVSGVVAPASRPNGLDCNQMGHYDDADSAPALGSLLQLDMSDAQIAASGAPAWEQTIMTAMAHYGMYINDTSGDGAGNAISIESQSDMSYTSLGQPPLMRNFMRQAGGTYYAPLRREILTGHFLSLGHFRVISPCFAADTCSGQPVASAARRHVRRRRAHQARAARPRAQTSVTRRSDRHHRASAHPRARHRAPRRRAPRRPAPRRHTLRRRLPPHRSHAHRRRHRRPARRG
ncbi:MAG: hypothetical protein JOZ07_16640 [Solirubrobacterales bacterium]|nr:hypothetical protein [Solirubrobacterales bacterium]